MITSNIIKTDVTCLKIHGDLVFAGIGGFLFVYNKDVSALIRKVHVFDEHKIFGIEFTTTLAETLIYGANKLKIFTNDFNSCEFHERKSVQTTDWILAAKWLNDSKNLATVSMHNDVYLWSKDLKLAKKFECEQRCILYCAHIIHSTWSELIILSGTVFSEIVIWAPSKLNEFGLSAVLHRLKGHKGVLFSLDYNSLNGIICSTSDDRTAILWQTDNLQYEGDNNKTPINKICTVSGHSARIFRCKVSKNFVVTAGEDSVVNIWSLEGKLQRKIEAHQGDCIWALDCDEDRNLLLTGGGDSAVTIHPLMSQINETKLQMQDEKVPKKIALMCSNNLVAISEKGALDYCDLENHVWSNIAVHGDLQTYALMQVSECRKLVSLSGFYGNVYIYKEIANSLHLICSHVLPHKSRIYSFHWLTCNLFLICTQEGILSLWHLKDGNLQLVNINQLPACSERWTTAATLIGDKNFVVGDRKGNLHLYTLSNLHPTQTIKKAHNYLGITDLSFAGNEIYSLGRNATLKTYQQNEKGRLVHLTSDKLPFSWLSQLLHSKTSSLLLAFSGRDFIVWDYNARRLILEKNCMGGHRSWDFHKKCDIVKFVFIKDKSIYLTTFNWKSLLPKDITSAYHAREINSLIALKLRNSYVFISGGEDTTLRLSITDFNQSFTTLSSLKAHLSSLRTITSYKISETDEQETHLVFSAGGRAQIVMWELAVKVGKDGTLNAQCREKFSYYETIDKEQSEMRIMDLCVIKSKSIVLFAACSDGKIKIFNCNSELILLTNVPYDLKCIIKICALRVLDRFLILTMATDGNVNFWDFTTFINNIEDKLQTTKPFYNLHCHQSGINSFSIEQISSSKFALLTGGDDNAIKLHEINFVEGESNLQMSHVLLYSNVGSHCAQITGAFITRHYFITASLDQKVFVFKWALENEEFCCELVGDYNSAISDIHGMQCFEEARQFKAVVYGKGVETLTIKKLEC